MIRLHIDYTIVVFSINQWPIVFRKVNIDGDKQHLQNDLDRLVKCSEKWQMLLNFGKCKCLHT